MSESDTTLREEDISSEPAWSTRAPKWQTWTATTSTGDRIRHGWDRL